MKYTNLILDLSEVDKKSPTYPYILHLEKDNKKLTYFGASHIFDPKHPQFSQIKAEFDKLNPDLVLWEGSVNLDLSSEEKSKKQGEGAYINYLAKQKNIESKNLDVPMEVDAEYQAEKFGKDATFAFFTLRQMNTLYRRMDQGQEITEEIVKDGIEFRIKELAGLLQWKDFPFTLENLKEIFKKLTRQELNFEIKKWERELIGQFYHLSVLNDIFRSSIAYRDIYTVNFIINEFKNYGKILAVMGGLHVYAEEPALKKFFEDYE